MTTEKHPSHCVDRLRAQAKQDSRRAFIARGANAERCPSCLMALFACFCEQRIAMPSPIHFTLLYHNTEIHKPTNSGRLIADLFPGQTAAYLWSRTTPDNALIERIASFSSNNVILFPSTDKRESAGTHLSDLPQSETPLNVIVLDATWRLASKMLHQSRWLDSIPTFAIHEEAIRSFKVRHAKHDNQFATAEVVAMLLAQVGAGEQSQALAGYYQTFNDRSMWSRRRQQTCHPT